MNYQLSPKIVLVKSIDSPIPRHQFSEAQLKQAAELILASGGVINPLILKRINLEHYQVIAGHFEYYAAATARALDQRRGESINAFIIESETEQALLTRQIEVFRSATTSSSTPVSNNMQARLMQVSKTFKDLNAVMKSLGAEIEYLTAEMNLTTPVESPPPEIAPIIPVEFTPEIPSPSIETEQTTLPEENSFLQALNNLPQATLTAQLKAANIAKRQEIVHNLIKARQEQPFQSEMDIVNRVKGLAEKTLEKIKPVLINSPLPTPTGHESPAPLESKPTLNVELVEEEPVSELDPDQAFLNTINTLRSEELAIKLARAQIKKEIRDNIDKARKQQPFSSQADMEKRVKGLGKTTLKKIRQLWP
ncbi:MAG: hypothetical protein SVR94_08645 [Pseudomonadota bacterium]|nr:hypothetical protein [Pseudomonadota bacterium]